MISKNTVTMLGVICVISLFTSTKALSYQTPEGVERQLVIAQALSDVEEPIKREPAEDIAKEYRQSLNEVIAQEPQEEESMPGEVTSYYRYQPRQGTSNNNGSVGITETAAEYTYELKAFKKIPIQLGIGAQYVGIDNSSSFSLPTRLTEVSTGVEVTLPTMLDQIYLRLGLIPSFFSDNWSFNSIDLKLLSQAFLIYKPSDDFILFGGIGSFPGFYNKIAPIGGMIYRPNDKLSFNIVPPRPTIEYALNKKLSIFSEYSFTDNEYKVYKDDMSNVTLQYIQQRAGLGLNYRFNKFVESSFSVGQIFNRRFQYRDSLGKLKIHSGLYVETRFNINM